MKMLDRVRFPFNLDISLILESSRRRYFISSFLSLILGITLYFRCTQPPYGYPSNELSDNYWGIIIDIAHKWRSLNFSFWDLGVGGGVSLFTSGQYPILNPTNIFAWFLNDNQFYLFKLIEPYVLGFFFMIVLLWDVFKLRFYVACFGALFYMGLMLSRYSAMAESPFFLYGCSIFPAMVLAYIKLARRHIYLAALGVGALVALQFAGEGVTQMPQMLIWWTIFFTVAIFYQQFLTIRSDSNSQNNFFGISHCLKIWILTLSIFYFSVAGTLGLQFIPTYDFFIRESARLSGHYSINNFLLWGQSPGGEPGLIDQMYMAFFQDGMVKTKLRLVLLLIGMAVFIAYGTKVFDRLAFKKTIYQILITTTILFLIPSVALYLANTIPLLKKIFVFLTYFSFRYALHTFEFCLITLGCFAINQQDSPIFCKKIPFLRKVCAASFLLLAFLVCLIPIILFISPYISKWYTVFPFLKNFRPGSFLTTLKVLVYGFVLIMIIAFRPRHLLSHLALAFILIPSMGFTILWDCFNYNGKGLRSGYDQFLWTSPEHNYFRNAKGKYSHQYIPADPPWMAYEYNLLYGVHGTAGFLSVAPLRLSKFIFYYDIRDQQDLSRTPFRGNAARFHIKSFSPTAITTYFPIDFTDVPKGMHLPWDKFAKVISGDQYDIYERLTPADKVYFANQTEIIDFFTMIRQFDKPRSNILYVVDEDASKFNIRLEYLKNDLKEVYYDNFVQRPEDKISFTVRSSENVFVIVPQCYQKGWNLLIDHRRSSLFPAYYLFMGFKLLGGRHLIEMTFIPPGLRMGIFVNIIFLLSALIFIVRYRKVCQQEMYVRL